MKTLDKELWKTQRWALLLLLLTAFWADASQADAFISRITQTPATPVSVGTPVTYRLTIYYPDGGVESNDDIGININDSVSGTVTSQFTPQTSPTSCVEEGSIWCSSSYPTAPYDYYEMTWTPSLGSHELTFSTSCLRSSCTGNSFSVTTGVIDPQAPPEPPVANAGPDQTVTDIDNDGFEYIDLDGSKSSDPNFDIVSYQWSENGTPVGIGVGITPTFNLAVGTHTIDLIVTDKAGNTSKVDSVDITINAGKPSKADAGADQIITATNSDGTGTVTLDGSNSYIIYYQVETYEWSDENGKVLSTGPTPSIDLDLGLGNHIITLTVYYAGGEGFLSDDVLITVNAATSPAVQADAGPDQTVIATNSDGTASVNLDASGTINPNNYIYTYEWHEYKNETYLGSGKTFTANLAEGTHTLTLEVLWGDSSKPISTDKVIITVQKPTSSNSEPGIEILSGANQRLSRGGTSAPLSIRALGTDGQPLDGTTITWSVTPADAATLSSQSTKTDANGESINTVITSASRPAIAFKVTASIPDGASARFTINPIAGISGLTPAQRSVANALDNACPALQALAPNLGVRDQASRNLTPDEQSLLSTCDYLASATDQEIISSLQQFLPDEVAAQGRNSISLARIRNKNILLRLDALRGGATGPSYENVSVSIQGEHLPSIVISELTKSKRGGAASADSSTIASPLGVFASGNISLGDTETTANEAGFDFETTGLTLGVDYRYSDQFVLGGAFNYLSTNSDYISQSSTLDIDGYSLSLYGSYYQSNKVFVDGILSIGLNSYDSKRDITSGGIDHNLYGDTDGAEYALSIGGGYEFNNQNLTFVPQARINYLRVDVDSYDETSSSSGLTLSIADQEIESLIASISGNISLAYSTQYGVFIPYLSIEWEHEFQNDSRAIIARFVNDPTRTQFSVLTDDPDQDYFFLGLGVTAAMANGKSAFLYYEQMLDHADTTQYTITGGFRLEF